MRQSPYERKGLKIERTVLDDIVQSQMQVIGGRKSSLLGAAKLGSLRTNRQANPMMYRRFGKKSSQTLMEIRAKIDLYNLTPRKVEPVTVNNVSYHLSGVGNRVVHGDDRSVNIVNEQELFERLTTAIMQTVQNDGERAETLAKLEELKVQKTKADYPAMVPKFVSAAASISHIIAPYLPALIERAESLL